MIYRCYLCNNYSKLDGLREVRSLEYEVDYLQNKCARLEAARRAVLKTAKEAAGTPGSAESQGGKENVTGRRSMRAHASVGPLRPRN